MEGSMDDRKDKAKTPLVTPYDEAERNEAPTPVETDAPVSTDANGDINRNPDLGGRID